MKYCIESCPSRGKYFFLRQPQTAVKLANVGNTDFRF